jgi:hypothetical protein
MPVTSADNVRSSQFKVKMTFFSKLPLLDGGCFIRCFVLAGTSERSMERKIDPFLSDVTLVVKVTNQKL